MGNVCCLLFPLRGFKIYDLVFLIEDNVVYRIHTFIHFGCAREPGKTRGAIGFALIFLCFVSLYQDKEMKRKDQCFTYAI